MNAKLLNQFAIVSAVLLTLLGTASARAGTITVVNLPPTSTDLATGITPNKHYVCAFNYGNQNATTYSVNSVSFTHFGWAKADNSLWATTNKVDSHGGRVVLSCGGPNTGNLLADTSSAGSVASQSDGNMRSILTDIVYIGGTITSNAWVGQEYDNLTPGDQYSLRIYYRWWSGDRPQNFWFNGEGTWQAYSGNPLDEDAGTNGVLSNGLTCYGARYIEYDFTAATTNVFCLATNVVAGNPFLLYATTVEDDSAAYPYAPFITYEPLPYVVGNPAAFTNIDMNVTAIGTGPLTNQWYYNTVSNYAGATMLTDGPGVTGSTTTNLSITQNLADYYFVVVSNLYGSITSSIAWYNPTPQFVVQATATNVGNSYVQYYVIAQGVPPVTNQWYVNTANSYSGATALADGSGYVGSATSALDATTNLQDYYFVVVSNYYGHATSSITSYNPKPSIVSQPGAFRSGNFVGFNVTAGGWPALAYQWYLNTVSNYTGATAMTDGSGVSGSQTASVTVNNVNDYYFVVVTNYYGSVTSQVAVVDSQQLEVTAVGEPIWNQTSQTNIIITFSDLLDPVTATIASNYSLTGAGTPAVLSATLGASNEVVLTTTPLSGSYTLTIQNVNDYYGIMMSPSSTNLVVGVYPANLALWVRANAANVTPDGLGYGGIDQWNDSSGSGNTLYGFDENAAPYDPVFTTNTLGDPVVRFTAANATEMFAESTGSLKITATNNAAISIVAVVNFATLNGGTNGEIVSKTGNGPSTDLNIPAPYDYYVGAADASLYRGNGGSSGDGNSFGQFTAPTGPSVGVPHVLVVSEYGNAVKHFLDGNFVGTGVLNGGFNVANIADGGNPLFVGSRADGAQWLTGDLAELMIAGSALSSYDVTQLSQRFV